MGWRLIQNLVRGFFLSGGPGKRRGMELLTGSTGKKKYIKAVPVFKAYAAYIEQRPGWMSRVGELRGRNIKNFKIYA